MPKSSQPVFHNFSLLPCWPFRRRPLTDEEFISAETEKLVVIFNNIVGRKNMRKYQYGAIMLRSAISALDEARKES